MRLMVKPAMVEVTLALIDGRDPPRAIACGGRGGDMAFSAHTAARKDSAHRRIRAARPDAGFAKIDGTGLRRSKSTRPTARHATQVNRAGRRSGAIICGKVRRDLCWLPVA